MRGLGVVFLLATLAALDLWLLRGLLWHLRWSWGCALLLMLLPVWTRWSPVAAFTDNLLELKQPLSLALAAVLNALCAAAIWASVHLFFASSGARYPSPFLARLGQLPPGPRAVALALWEAPPAILVLLLATPLLVGLQRRWVGPRRLLAACILLTGAGLAALLGALAEQAFQVWPWALPLFPNPGYNQNPRQHTLMLVANLGALGILLGMGVLGDPRRRHSSRQVAAIVYLIACIELAAITMPGLAYALDYHRVPAEILVLLFLGGVWLLRRDHPIPTHPGRAPVGDGGGPEEWSLHREALRARLGDHTVAIVVCAHGGGIQAAAWTTRVLAGLEDMAPRRFQERVVLMSGASGGAVGLAYITAALRKGLPLWSASAAAREGSLDALAWGILFPDLLWAPFRRTRDRGTVLEGDWRHIAREGQILPSEGAPLRLTTLAREVQQGALPLTVLNATVTETGLPFTLSPLPFPPLEVETPTDWWQDNPDRDLDWFTAARLSATFPYVTPMARLGTQPPLRAFHLADGGYIDNSGLLTASRWIQAVIPEGVEVLLLEIDGFPPEPPPPPHPPRRVNGLGPLLLLFRVLSSSQTLRRRALLGDIPGACFRIQPSQEAFSRTAPLSWQLSQRQQQEVDQAWEEWRRSSDGQALQERLRRL